MSVSTTLRFAFSPTGASFLVVNNEGRFRLFDTGTGRLQVEFAARATQADTAQPCTCFAWASAEQQTKNSPVRQFVVVGNGAGELAAYDTALAEEVWRLADCHQGGVTGVAWAGLTDPGQHIYSVGADKGVCVVDVVTGKLQQRFQAGKHALTCIKAASDGQRVMVGGAGLAMWDASSQQRLYKYPGHATPVDAVAFSPDGQYAMSSSRGERHVAVWKATGKVSKKTKPAAAVLSLDQPPVQLDAAASADSAGSHFSILAVSSSGRLYVWQCQVTHTVQATLRATIQVEKDSAETSTSSRQEPIHAACFESATGEDTVVVARGSSAKPFVERVHLPAAAAEPACIRLKPQQAEGLLLHQTQKGKQGATKAASQQATAEAVGADNAGHPVLLKGQTRKRQADTEPSEAEAALDTQAPELQPAVVETRVQDGQEEQDNEPTLEQRVQALHLQQGQASVDTAGPSAKATSVTVLLSQALRSNDHQLLEKCFAMSNDKVVKSTVRQLAPADAARLLQVAVQRLQSSPHRGKQIAAWVRALLLYHTAYLISAPGVQGSLTGLYQTIEARLALYKPLASLQGRLDLVLAQAAPQDPLASHLAAGPMIFHDEDNELQEAEVENVLALQGADEGDTESDGSDDLDKSDTESSAEESDADE